MTREKTNHPAVQTPPPGRGGSSGGARRAGCLGCWGAVRRGRGRRTNNRMNRMRAWLGAYNGTEARNKRTVS